MIDYASARQNELLSLLVLSRYNSQNSYFFMGNGLIKLKNNFDRYHEFVSINHSGDIIGFFVYELSNDCAINFSTISFSNKNKDKIIFAKDLLKVLKNIFDLFHCKKISFSANVNHPELDKYKKLVKIFDGEIEKINKDYILFSVINSNYSNKIKER